MKRNLRHAATIGPPNQVQLDRWAREHERMWDRIAGVGVVLLGLGLIGLLGLAAIEWTEWVGRDPSFRALVLGQLAMFACMFAIFWLWWHCMVRRDLHPVNPYRPTDMALADLERANASYPHALAYLDAIRHQGRPIVQYDIDVLALIRQQPQSNQGE